MRNFFEDWLVPGLIGLAVIILLSVLLASAIRNRHELAAEAEAGSFQSGLSRVRFLEGPGVVCGVLVDGMDTPIAISCAPAPQRPAETP